MGGASPVWAAPGVGTKERTYQFSLTNSFMPLLTAILSRKCLPVRGTLPLQACKSDVRSLPALAGLSLGVQ